MSLENDTSDTSHTLRSNDPSSITSSAIDESTVTIANTGQSLISHQINGNVSSATNVQTNCTIIHQQNVTNV